MHDLLADDATAATALTTAKKLFAKLLKLQKETGDNLDRTEAFTHLAP